MISASITAEMAEDREHVYPDCDGPKCNEQAISYCVRCDQFVCTEHKGAHWGHRK